MSTVQQRLRLCLSLSLVLAFLLIGPGLFLAITVSNTVVPGFVWMVGKGAMGGHAVRQLREVLKEQKWEQWKGVP